MTVADTHSPISLDLTDARLHLSLKLPAGWSWQLAPGLSRADRQLGKVAPRLTARSDATGVELQVGASHMPLPQGLVPAVVYWCSLYELDVPESPAQWGPHDAFISYSAPGTTPHVCMILMKVADSVIELRIEAEATVARDELIDWLQRHLEFKPLAVAEAVAPEPWWARVKRLREVGKLEEAIRVAERDGDRAEVLLVQADLHIERMRLAQAAGDIRTAREAWQSASKCAHAYAASATSGGEGLARSQDRDRLLAQLGPEPTQEQFD